MTDNPEPCNAPVFPLGEYSVIELAGRDAAAFAQAQFMNDVLLLAPGAWQWNGWLSPKGRVLALFALLRTGEEAFWMVLSGADAEGLAAQLRRFVFRSKVAIKVREDVHAAGAYARPPIARGSESATEDGSVELDLGTSACPRTLRLGADASRPTEPGRDAEWHAADLRAGLPRLPGSELERWTPQQLSLDRLRAFSVKKGCYPGQEIVARTHFLGQAKRGLALFEADRPVTPGTTVDVDGAAWGSLVSAATVGDRTVALGIGNLERTPVDARAGDARLMARPFDHGLAR